MGEASPKIIKSDQAGKGYLSAIMYLAPHKLSGYNVCQHASPGCISTCLNTSGRGRTNSVQEARIRRTEFFFSHREKFLAQLDKEIGLFAKRADAKKLKPAVRLNGTSDLDWFKIVPALFEKYSAVQFYDYTKSVKRYQKWIDGLLPINYHLTFSRSENNYEKCVDFLKQGGSVAVVFRGKNIPNHWNNYRCYNADETDLRFLDRAGVQALYAKGKAKHDQTGFVLDN
jgi:hypothetical protein